MLNYCAAATVADFSAGDVAATVVVGVLIVFAVLAIIYLCLVALERVFHPTKKEEALALESPVAGSVLQVFAANSANKGDTVLTIVSPDGTAAILAPEKGSVSLKVKAGDTVKKGDLLFTLK